MRVNGQALIAVVISFLIIPSFVAAQEWITANQASVTWDKVTTFTNGKAIPEDNIIEYKIYLSDLLTDPGHENPIEAGSTNSVEYTITLGEEGQYFVGLQTIRKLSDGTIVGESVIGWSDDPAIVHNESTFGLRLFFPPPLADNLRPK